MGGTFFYLHFGTKTLQVDEIEQEMRSPQSVRSAGLVFGDRLILFCDLLLVD